MSGLSRDGINTEAWLDTQYLQLDCANDPLTGSLDITFDTSTNEDYGQEISVNSTATSGIQVDGLKSGISSNTVITTGNSIYTGIYGLVAKRGADTSTGLIDICGVQGIATNTGSTDAGSKDIYGGHFYAEGDTNGDSTAFGIYAAATGADINYAGYFEGCVVATGISQFGNIDTSNYAQFASDGELTLVGTARITQNRWIPFNALKAPGTKPDTFKEWGISGVWEFSDDTDDTIVFNLQVPLDMDITVAPSLIIGWSTNTAVTTETAVWQLEYLWTSAGEDTTAAAQETLTVNSNAVAQANGLIIAEITGIDLPSDTDACIHCRLKRLGEDEDDDLTDTAELHGVCLKYTANKLGTALT